MSITPINVHSTTRMHHVKNNDQTQTFLDGKLIRGIVLIGTISQVVKKYDKLCMIVHDCTGVIAVEQTLLNKEGIEDEETRIEYENFDIVGDDATRQLEIANSVMLPPHICEGKYIKIFGTMCFTDTAPPVIIAHRVLPVVDFNEITQHSLEIIHTHLMNTR